MRTSIIHVSSQNRSNGTINDFENTFKHCHLVQENYKGRIIIEPIQAVVPRSWYTVDENNDTFELSNDNGITWQTLSITHANYNIKTFLVFLKSFLVDWTLGWSQEKNKYYFFPPDDGKQYRFRFRNYSAFLFGCLVGDEVSGRPFVSTMTVNMERSKVILIHSNLPCVKGSRVDNLSSTQMEESNIFLKIPISSPPWSNLIWRSKSRDVVSFQLSSNSISSVRFWLTDEYNIPIILTTDWTLSFRVTYIDENNDQLINMLTNIESYLKYMTLQQMSSSEKKISSK